MKQTEKKNLILKKLYKKKYDNEYHQVTELLKDTISINQIEAYYIATSLEDQGYIYFSGDIDSAIMAAITPDGVEYIEPLIEKETENSILLNMVDRVFGTYKKGRPLHHNISEFKNELETELLNIDVENDKLIYLKGLYDILSTGLENHKEICKKPGNCPTDNNFKEAIFIVKRKVENINNYDSSYDPSENHSEVNQKLDSILKLLEKIQVGQEITYDDLSEEINDLRGLIPRVGENRFRQLLIGVLVDWLASKIIDLDTFKKASELIGIDTQYLN